MMQMEPFRTNSAALGRVQELWGTHGFHNPFIVLEGDEILWNVAELGRVISGEDESAPIPRRWRKVVVDALADYLLRGPIRYPVRSGNEVWPPEKRAAWEDRMQGHVAALRTLAGEALTADDAAGVRAQVDAVLATLREESVFISDNELMRRYVLAFSPT